MRIGLVARGPRHVLLPERRGEVDVLIGVNHAAAWHPCDWWSFGDAETHATVTPTGSPRWFTNQNAINRILAREQFVPADVMVWEEVAPDFTGRDEAGMGWAVFSATAAIVLAKRLGATSVLCFGVVDESPVPGESQRWATERRIWNAVCEWSRIPIFRA